MSLKSQSLSSHLQTMKFEMELRGHSPQTQSHYLCHLRQLEKHFNKPALQITPEELKLFLHHRIKSGISYSNVNISCNAFKLFFNKVLSYNWSDDVIVRPKRPKALPHVLSKDEILSIMDQVPNLKYKTILLTTYSSGLRISETLNLRIKIKLVYQSAPRRRGPCDQFYLTSRELPKSGYYFHILSEFPQIRCYPKYPSCKECLQRTFRLLIIYIILQL